jgi:hypothetical protein
MSRLLLKERGDGIAGPVRHARHRPTPYRISLSASTAAPATRSQSTPLAKVELPPVLPRRLPKLIGAFQTRPELCSAHDRAFEWQGEVALIRSWPLSTCKCRAGQSESFSCPRLQRPDKTNTVSLKIFARMWTTSHRGALSPVATSSTLRRCNKGLAKAKPLSYLVPAAGLEPAT